MKMSKENNSDDEGNHNDIGNCDGTIENKIDNLHPLEYDQEVIDKEEDENVDNDNVFDATVEPEATSRLADKESMHRKKVLSIVAISMIIFIGITIWLVVKSSRDNTSTTLPTLMPWTITPSISPSTTSIPSISSTSPSSISSTSPTSSMSPTRYNQYVTRNILMILYKSTSGEQWKKKVGWSSWNNYCKWYGVSCNEDDEVVKLNLYNNNLVRSIPSQLDTLTKLTSLVLSANSLRGTIPTEIVKLTDLKLLDIGGNQLTGTIPSQLGDMTPLTDLRLERNKFIGTIASTFGKLTDMKLLLISNNRLEGTIPSQLGNLTSLTSLYLYENRLTGTISSTFVRLTNLRGLYLYDNNLSGIFPEVLCDNKWNAFSPMIDCDEIDCRCCNSIHYTKCSI